ncbi:MAG: Rrf2 family transcriptional regulator [Gammaproteobacteria bacterium]|nr:Rrf2 family transcriptional regulator [Gammaproteobacteria bacterium]MBA3731178.1 Rrf2 family transcriptional regulator [Gammaproteobacteria bacterium]
MDMTNRTRYAIAAMLDLARAVQPVPLSELARQQAISRGYLDKLLARLCARGLLMRSAGVEHDFWLARPPAEIALAEIVAAVHARSDRCRRRNKARGWCATRRPGHYLWDALNQGVADFLAGISLADLLTREHVFGTLPRARRPRLRAVPSPAVE